MKRHPSLIPVSRQHHGGLLTARLLQYGAPPYKGMPTTAAGKRTYVLQFYKDSLQSHFAVEEATIFEFARSQSEALREQADKLAAEHQQLTELILALPSATETALPEKLHEIGQLLEHHIRQEERVLFEQLQQELSTEKLQQLQEQIRQLMA